MKILVVERKKQIGFKQQDLKCCAGCKHFNPGSIGPGSTGVHPYCIKHDFHLFSSDLTAICNGWQK